MFAKCCCTGCNAEGTVKSDSFRRGGRAVYMCRDHAFRLMGYTDENHNRLGNVKENGFTFSWENETSSTTVKGRSELLQAGFIPTSDCTVNVEYKSSIYEGLNAFSKQCVTIERLIASGDCEIGSGCGSHFHVGHHDYINRETIDYIARFYQSLFIPLSDEMREHHDETVALFGRFFTGALNDYDGGYARYITHDMTDRQAKKHEIFINLQHDWTIEYRLPKFINAKQYQTVGKMCKEFTSAIIENFIKHFNEEPTDRNRYATITEYRKHKADVTAQKLVRIYRKYAGIR